jgi:hypothetical protein
MWREIRENMAQYPAPVLSGTDEKGYPFSLRCTPQADEATQTLHITSAASAGLTSGPANLTFHKHDEAFWSIEHFTVIGTLERDEAGWVFRPVRLLPGLGYGGPLSQFQLLVRARRTASHYLAKRNLSRPKIPWHEIDALWAELKATESS